MTSTVVGRYCQLFRDKNLAALRELLHPEITLRDPFVREVSGLEAVSDEYRKIFSNKFVSFDVDQRYKLNDSREAFSFTFVLEDREGATQTIKGVDCLTVESGKIISIDAYLTLGT